MVEFPTLLPVEWENASKSYENIRIQCFFFFRRFWLTTIKQAQRKRLVAQLGAQVMGLERTISI